MATIILKSTDRINNTITANNAEFYLDWSVLEEGRYKVTYSICKQIKPPVVNPWVFRVKSSTLTVPATVDGLTIINNNNIMMINDTVRGPVFNFVSTGCLSVNQETPVNSTKTLWVMIPKISFSNNNVFSSTKMPVWFNGTTLLRATVNFGGAGATDIVSTTAQSNVWKHYAITTTATQSNLYVNGVLVKTGVVNWAGDTASLFFGAYNGQSFYSGRLDDMRLYSSALSATEINDIYTSTLL